MMRAVVIGVIVAITLEAGAGEVAEYIQSERAKAVASQSAAQESIASLQALVSQKRALGLGLDDAADKLSVGPFQPIRLVRLDHLRALDPNGFRMIDVLTDSGRVFYPVMEDTTTRSAVEVYRTPAKWETWSVGGENLANQVTETVARFELQEQPTLIVEIPALQLRFIAFAKDLPGGDTMMLALIGEAPTLAISPSVTHSAEQILRYLIPFAKAHDGNPT